MKTGPGRKWCIGHHAAYGLLTAVFLLAAGCGDKAKDTAQSAQSFYKGKNITLVVGFSPGGGYDMTGRAFARHFGRFVPGHPEVIVQNMPGAGSLIAANYMYNIAPKDGTMIGLFVSSMPLAPIWRKAGAHFDALEISWLGSVASAGASSIVVRSDAPATTLAGAREKEIVIGSAGPDSTTSAYPLLLNELAGTKFKVLYGYPGTAEVWIAFERGEVQARADTDWIMLGREHPEWIESGFVKPLVQTTLKPHPALKGVPMALDFAKTELDRQVMRLAFGVGQYTRAFSLAPGVPEERLAVLREAFREMVDDPEYRADMARSLKQDMDVAYHDEIEAYVREAYSAPEEVRVRAAEYVAME